MELLIELLAKQLEFQKSLEGINKMLFDQAQKKQPPIQLDHQAIANQIRAGLPSAEQFEKVNEQLKHTISTIPNKISVQTPDDILGFINVKSLLVHYGTLFFVFLILLGYVIYSKDQEIDDLQTTVRRQENFVDWIQEKHPEAWKHWEKQ